MKIITHDKIDVVGIKVNADWQGLHTKMPEAWEKFSARLNEVQYRKGDIMLDVSLDVQDGIYTQLIGVETERMSSLPVGMVSVTIPQQQYLTYRHEGPVQDIAASFGKMYEWAKVKEINAGEFKIDRGYTLSGNEKEHELFVKIT